VTESAKLQPAKRTNIHSGEGEGGSDSVPTPSGIVARVRALPLWRPLRLPSFRRLWAGSAASLLADQTFFVVLTFLVLQVAGPGAQLGAVLAVAAVPGAILLPLGGWLSDRFPPAAIMTVTSTGRALLMGALAALVLLGDVALWQLYLLGGLLSALDAFYYPASMSIVPSLVADDQLEPANALVQGAEQVSGMIGPVLAAGLAATVGLGAAFGATALAFALAAAAFAAVAAATRDSRPASAKDEGGIAAIVAGARYAWGDPVIRVLLLMVAALNTAAAGPIVVGSAVLATERLGGPGALGVVYAGFGAGSLLGVLAAGSLTRGKRRGRMLLAATAGFGFGLAAFGLAPSLPVAVAIAAVMGAMGGYLGVVLVAWLQERAAPELLGRVMSLVVFAAVALDPVSYAVTGLLVAGGVERLFLGAGGAMAITAAVAALSRDVREYA
jgi:MFS family permease